MTHNVSFNTSNIAGSVALTAQSANENVPSFSDIDFVREEEAITKSGIVPQHVSSLQAVAERFKTILMFRPVNHLSTGLLQEGAVAKGMHIKAKTSDWGPMAGLIPSDQALSKKWKSYLTEPPQSPIQDNITESSETSVFSRPLVLSASRINFLVSNHLIRLPSSIVNGAKLTSCDVEIPSLSGSNDNPGQHFAFRLVENSTGEFEVLYQKKSESGQTLESEWKPLKVLNAYIGPSPMSPENLANDYSYGPITADYDAFAYLPHTESSLLTPLPPRSNETMRDRFTQIAQHVRENQLGQKDRLVSKPNIGREPSWQGVLRDKINMAIGSKSNHLVQHATEMDNVFVPEQDEQIFIVTPDKKCFLTRNWAQVQAAMYIASHHGYYGYSNRNYNHEAGTRAIYSDMKPEQLKTKGTTISFDPVAAYQKLVPHKAV